jgi:hypothetical protein
VDSLHLKAGLLFSLNLAYDNGLAYRFLEATMAQLHKQFSDEQAIFLLPVKEASVPLFLPGSLIDPMPHFYHWDLSKPAPRNLDV